MFLKHSDTGYKIQWILFYNLALMKLKFLINNKVHLNEFIKIKTNDINILLNAKTYLYKIKDVYSRTVSTLILKRIPRGPL